MREINGYFEYLENEVNLCERISKIEKDDFIARLSFYKVSGYSSVEYFDLDIVNVEAVPDSELHLYLLFEYLSTRIFTIKTYKNWLIE